jgi:lipoprotein-anchoring transpeptidase ErfK/SrfK
MRRAALAAVLCGLAFAAPALAQPLKGGAIDAVQIDAVLTVLAVDQKARTVTVRGPKGGVTTLNVPPQAQNLDQVKQGSQFRMKYLEAIAVGIRKGGTPAAVATQDVRLAPKGGTPGGVVVRTQQLAAVVDAIDLTNRYIAVRGPKGNTLALKVADGVNLEGLSAGDRIALTHTEALAMEMIPQAPAKKPAAKKAAPKKEG